MKDYLLHTLSAGAFEELVVQICHEILGFGTICFSSGKDGGRDAFFDGTAQRFPSEVAPWAGQFVIQAKHTERFDSGCSESDFARILRTEAPKVSALRLAGRCDNYLLFTNRKLGALTEERLVKKLRQKTGIANVAILGRETLVSYLDGAPDIAEALGLQVSTFATGLPSIPPPTRDFVGRTKELEELQRMVARYGGILIYGVRGLGGIGKTELCLKLAEMVGANYADGHILVELGGASDHPLSSGDALAHVIRAYEPQARPPESEEDLRRLYHQLLKGRRAIVLLDDAVSAEQVEPLLPHTGCLTLITSRQRFALPKLHRLDLDALTAEAARELLISLSPRLSAEAGRMADLLGRLPLALRLAGSAFAERPDLAPGEYIGRLKRRGERVGLVEAAISFNYEALPAEQRRLWRALAVFPSDFDAAGAAAVWAMKVNAAKDVLGGALYAVSLVEWRGGRCSLHDLARDFATSCTEDGEWHIAARRHAGHYAEMLGEAERLYQKGGSSILEGLSLFDTEWNNIRAGQAWARTHANNIRKAAEYCSVYSGAGPECLSLRLHPNDRICWFEAGRSAAASLDDQRGEGVGLCNLGLAYASLGKVEEAIDNYDQALVIVRKLGDQRGETYVLGNLAIAYARSGDLERAIGYFEQILRIHRETGDRRSEAKSLDNLGHCYGLLGEAEKAIGNHQQALVIEREIGDRRGEGGTLSSLGAAYVGLEEMATAISYGQQALVIAREIGDRRLENSALGHLGMAYCRLGEVEQAIGYFEQKMIVAREIGDRRGEGVALHNLGEAYSRLGKMQRATTLMEHALDIGQAINDPQIVSEASKHLDRLRGS